MKALSVKQPWAHRIIKGLKNIEYRSWSTDYRGPLLICSSKTPDAGGEFYPLGMALGVVDLINITYRNGQYLWHLRNPRRFKEPFPVRGKIKLFDVDYDYKEL